MAYETKSTLSADNTIKLGGKDSKTNKANPTFVEGYYLGAKNTETTYGEGKLHIFQTAKGNVGVWGKTNMDRLLTSDHVGQMCLLTFTGMGQAQKGRNAPYNYKLQFDRANTVDVSNIDLSATDESEPDYNDEPLEETAVEDDTADYVSEPVVTARAATPRQPARTPNAEQQAKVRALLAGKAKSA